MLPLFDGDKNIVVKRNVTLSTVENLKPLIKTQDDTNGMKYVIIPDSQTWSCMERRVVQQKSDGSQEN